MGQVNNRVKTNVKVETRLRVLTWAVSEYAHAFGADKNCLDTIEKGIYQRQIIEQITFEYFHSKEFVGRITLKIDWACHEMLVNDEDGKMIQIRKDQSILKQLDEASQVIQDHVARLRKECKVNRIETCYHYRSEYTADDAKHEAARAFLGHISAKDRARSEPAAKFKTIHRLVMGKLKELEVIVES